MQNVGKRISHKEKKRILSLDTIHESIDSGSGRRGGKEKKAPIDSQNMSLTRNTEKKFHSLPQRIPRQISQDNAVFWLIFRSKVPSLESLLTIFFKKKICYTSIGDQVS